MKSGQWLYAVVLPCSGGQPDHNWTPLGLPTGLRTLCFATADISEAAYREWLQTHHRAATALQNRAVKLEESYDLMEKVRSAAGWADAGRRR